MKNIVNDYVEKFQKRHRNYKKYLAVCAVLAVITVIGVNWQLHQTGISMTSDYQCGLEEHQHSADCYTRTPTCGMEESDEEGGHHHTEDCYTDVLTCDKPEHTHTTECLIDTTADVETAEDWEATLPQKLSGVWSDDVVAIAKSQLGYQESTKNFEIADDGETMRGYTRYGDWYGSEYGDWSGMFAAFCLHYAEIPEEDMPVSAGCDTWLTKLQESGQYQDKQEYQPAIGDLVFVDSEENGTADHVGIIETFATNDDGSLKKLTVIEGDSSDAVEEKTYAADDVQIIGYSALPEQPKAEDAEEATDEETPTADETEATPAAAAQAASGDAVDICNVTVTVNLDRPADLKQTVTVYLVNQNTGEHVKEIQLTTSDKSKTVTFTQLPRLDSDGNEISYGVELQKVDGYVSGYNTSNSDQTNTWEQEDQLWVPAKSITTGKHYLLLTSNEVGENKSNFIRTEGTINPKNMLSSPVSLSAGPIQAADGTSYSPYLKAAPKDGDKKEIDGALWTAGKNGDGFYFQSDYLKDNNQTYYLETATSLNEKADKSKWKLEKNTNKITSKNDSLYVYEKVEPVYGTIRTLNMTVNASYTTKGEAEKTQEYTTVRVSKQWQDKDGNPLKEDIPSSLKVTLNADGKKASVDAPVVTLTADNNWTYEWKVPRYSFEDGEKKEITYTVSEEQLSGFTAQSESKKAWGDEISAWVPVDDFEDNCEYILTTSPLTGSVGALTATSSKAHWANGNQSNVTVKTGSIQVGDTIYSKYIEDSDSLGYVTWKTGTGKEIKAEQHGKHKMWTLYNEKVGGYLKNNGEGDISSDIKEECWFYYNWYTYIGEEGKRPPSNPKSEWSNVLGGAKDYFLLSNNHTGDAGSETAQTFYLYKKVTARPVTQEIVLTNKSEGKSYELPATGGSGMTKFAMGGIALCGIALCGYSMKRRRAKRG